MLFQSPLFLAAFLVPVLIVFFATRRFFGVRWAAIVLTLSSLIFYSWNDRLHLPVLVGSLVGNFVFGRCILRTRGAGARLWLLAGVALNLAVLMYFRYAPSVVEHLGAGPTALWNIRDVAFPLGLSFYTFQQIGLLVDVWHGQVLQTEPREQALFGSFFPQLIAGPIVRWREFAPQLSSGDFGRWRTARVVGGVAIFVLGLGKKQLIADPLGADADLVFGLWHASKSVGLIEGWLGLLAYSFQIYFDFSAYTDMAIGLGLLFGVTLPENFAAPYRAASIIEFWRRWHMTLSRFLRDYVYIPLGGNANGRPRQSVALFTTMLVAGIWHGAAITFLVWGLWHALALIINHLWRAAGIEISKSVAWGVTFVVVALGWVLFRSTELADSAHAFRDLLGLNGLWPAETPGFSSWVSASLVPAWLKDGYDVFPYLGLTGQVGSTGIQWRQLLLNEWTWRSLRAASAFIVILTATPVVRWLWSRDESQPRFSPRKACVVGLVGAALLLNSGSVTPSTFIYFRF
jgi:alginate O-acetyltransferase complex protein AlgI